MEKTLKNIAMIGTCMAVLIMATTSCRAARNNETDSGSTKVLDVKNTKTLVAYFSAEGHTESVAKEIARLTGADIYKIEPAVPYAKNPYDDADKIKQEAYNDLRPAVGNLPNKDFIAQFDTLYVGTPCWWHQPAMVVCTFLEAYDLNGKVVIPFVTYGATTYLNETMQKMFKLTPHSKHIPATLPEDLNPDDITTPGPDDDEGIDMPGNARGTESWLKRIGTIK